MMDGVTASLTDVGMDVAPVINLMNGLSSRNVDHVHSIVVIKNSKLVFEEYFSGEDLDLTNNQLNFVHKDFDRNTLQVFLGDALEWLAYVNT